MKKKIFNLSDKEQALFKRLFSPVKIQDFIDTLPINWTDDYLSPREVLRYKKAHCLEGALLAAAILWFHGQRPLLLDLKVREHQNEEDHVVALYKRNGYWGAVSKTNHATLRFRDPVYKTIRELVLSYFHEYFNDRSGRKVLESHSGPFDLRKFGTKWIVSEDDLYFIAEAIDEARHFPIVPDKNRRLIRKADAMERRAGKITEWKKNSGRKDLK